MEGKDSDGTWDDIAYEDVEIGDQIGGGGFALVYKGKYKGKSVALKTLFDPKVDDKLKREYMEELHSFRMLNHPNVVKFIGASTKPPKMFMVMELCGPSLFHILHQTKLKWTDSIKVNLMTQIASAMNYLHTRKPLVVHRDLKSHNVLVNHPKDPSRITAKLCDFGLVSTKVVTAGTPNYMAPELLNSKPYSAKVDVYAFGILLWEMWARKIPFGGWKPSDIKEEVCKGARPPLPIPDCPEDIVQLMQECWRADPSDRPTMEAVHERLRSWKPKVSAVDSLRGTGGGDSLDALLGM